MPSGPGTFLLPGPLRRPPMGPEFWFGLFAGLGLGVLLDDALRVVARRMAQRGPRA